ncbi:MAG: glutaredoxin family protein [Thermoplasmatota archaeon]
MDLPGISNGPSAVEPDAPPGPQAMPPRRPSEGPSTFLVVKTPTCTWCAKTMDFLKALHEERGDFQVAVLDANEQPQAFRQLTAQTRRTTVPQIFLDGGFVGGWSELAQAAKAGQLDAYLDGEDWTPAAPEPKRRWWRKTGNRS